MVSRLLGVKLCRINIFLCIAIKSMLTQQRDDELHKAPGKTFQVLMAL